MPVEVPAGVEVTIEGRNVQATGPKGSISWEHHRSVSVEMTEGRLVVRPASREKIARAMHGTARQLIQNMITGVSVGFEKRLEIVGVGYNAKIGKGMLALQVGYCDPVILEIPEGLSVETPRPTQIVVAGVNKQQVGQFAANVRRSRPPEPYKGKGIRYLGEEVHRKVAKSFGAA